MFYCNLAKTPRIPVFSKVSRAPKSSESMRSFSSRSLSHCPSQELGRNSYGRDRPEGVCWNAPLSITGQKGDVRRRCFVVGIHLSNGVGNISAIKRRLFSSVRRQNISEYGDVVRSGKAPPSIAAYKERGAKRAERRAAPGTNPSVWEESANSYFSKNSRVDTAEDNVNDRRSSRKGDEVNEEEEDAEPIDDPRWDNIKTTYRGFMERESRRQPPEAHRWSKQENWGKKTWKEATESSVPKMVGQSVYGVGPVLAALTIQRREFYALYVQESLDLSGNNRKKKDKKGIEKVFKMAEKIGLKIVETSKHDLNMMVDNRPHQGLVLDASPLEMINVRELEPPSSLEGVKAPLWLALDEVTDPQNLGAIIRSAYFFGAQGVVLCAKNSAPLSGVVSKASAGSLELIELMSCKNMMQFLSSSIANGWRVLGGSVSSRALPLGEVEAGVPTILVLGSEGSGLRPLVERSCTQLIRIPGSNVMDGHAGETEVEVGETDQGCPGQELMKTFLAVESLNVSVAAGVLLYHLAGKIK